jgi:hypothetical protein
MRTAFAILTVALLPWGCGRDEDLGEKYVVRYTLEGALAGDRKIAEDPLAPRERLGEQAISGTSPAFGGARVACTIVPKDDRDPDSPATFALSAVENYGDTRGIGVYVKTVGFAGVGTYAVADAATGAAFVFDDGHIQACVRAGDRSCYTATAGCTIEVARLSYDEGAAPPGSFPGARWGEAEGSFRCESLVNRAAGRKVAIRGGSFRCRVSDWRPASTEAPR